VELQRCCRFGAGVSDRRATGTAADDAGNSPVAVVFSRAGPGQRGAGTGSEPAAIPAAEDSMAIHKVIEVLAQSEKSWEDAAQAAVADAGKTVKHIKSIYIKNFEAVVERNRIVEYRVNANITFEVGATRVDEEC
jgi:flavin-binding protein dodecin